MTASGVADNIHIQKSVVADGEDSKLRTGAKVLEDFSIVCRHCDFHMMVFAPAGDKHFGLEKKKLFFRQNLHHDSAVGRSRNQDTD